MTYRIIRHQQGRIAPKLLRYRFRLRGEAEKMAVFFNKQARSQNLFQILFLTDDDPANRAGLR